MFFWLHLKRGRIIHVTADQFQEVTIVIPFRDFMGFIGMPKEYDSQWDYSAKGRFLYAEEIGKEFKLGMN